MDIAALVTWVITALGGFYMLGTWLARGGARGGNSHLPVPVVFGHFALAAIGLVVWIAYLVADTDALAWIAFVLLVPVALLGFVMLARWIPVYRARTAAGAQGGGAAQDGPAERNFPVAVVLAHGLLAVVTVVLVLLSALGVGGN
ncbi:MULTISPECIES: hypothetical protein [unclassified Streptomyces]|uniref:hypothetical protein n=1 Tax=unclassified Streptomyces TaxID=2593676 RepID=UPI000DAE1C30|nr:MULTISPECIES: hypothetical protein [unclassified Streptomyces]PZT71754.1 hypothetical protein DNK55_31980 [Streptomyces sp. AC1-42T]PZT73121.1 hypothetical protein DNK56_33095 [Streptomyces sp. AC1-42W]